VYIYNYDNKIISIKPTKVSKKNMKQKVMRILHKFYLLYLF